MISHANDKSATIWIVTSTSSLMLMVRIICGKKQGGKGREIRKIEKRGETSKIEKGEGMEEKRREEGKGEEGMGGKGSRKWEERGRREWGKREKGMGEKGGGNGGKGRRE